MSIPESRDHLIECALLLVENEIDRQDEGWGVQRHPGGNGSWDWALVEERVKKQNDDAVIRNSLTWLGILYEEVAEAFAAKTDEHYVEELIQVAAVAVQAAVDIRARNLGYENVEGYE